MIVCESVYREMFTARHTEDVRAAAHSRVARSIARTPRRTPSWIAAAAMTGVAAVVVTVAPASVPAVSAATHRTTPARCAAAAHVSTPSIRQFFDDAYGQPVAVAQGQCTHGRASSTRNAVPDGHPIA